ncbi:hypothetical protein PR202_ga10050 [Eleusine coracana subsp. coracana]|uniref:Uncharacterized protein n=1 Tax=Eleusine coracana subsp. coracana TaxID=191504 RepID=A0AAV5C5Q2_ELECO|nr:hypothetical protein PR202_ga10050 [Eleusine coracana subsp. coracana]
MVSEETHKKEKEKGESRTAPFSWREDSAPETTRPFYSPIASRKAYNNITTGVICHGKASVIKEGHKSFPSGHTSCT